MRVFELHINPKQRNDKIFGSFVYEPDLCMAGELKKTLPHSKNFLEKLSLLLKEEHAKAGFQSALRQANDFLNQEAKQGNVDWLGNLNFAALNIDNYVLNFTKVGDIKILLIREGEILDISENLEFQDQESYPLKVFSNAASGKLSPNDKILILTREIFANFLTNQELVNQFTAIQNEKDFNNIAKTNKQLFSELSGLCLLLLVQEYKGKTPQLPQIFLPKMPKTMILVIALALIFLISYFLFSI